MHTRDESVCSCLRRLLEAPHRFGADAETSSVEVDARVAALLEHRLQDIEDCIRVVSREDPLAFPEAFRTLIAIEVNGAVTTGADGLLVSSLVLCAVAAGTAHWYGLFDLIAEAARQMSVGSEVQHNAVARFRIEGYRGLGAAYVASQRFLVERSLDRFGWIKRLDVMHAVYRFDPAASMPEEMAPPQAGEQPSVHAFDVDMEQVHIGLLPIPSGRDRRTAAFVETLRTKSAFSGSVGSMTPAMERVALLFAHRWAVHAARGSSCAQLKTALLAACLPPLTKTYDPAVREIALILHVATCNDCGVEDLVTGVIPLLDADREGRLRLILGSSVPYLDIAGLRQVAGPEGVEFL